MDLPTVKAAVKAWEKAFKASRGRVPTKDDIKNDSSNISEQYALYRRLVKGAGSSSQSSQTITNTNAPQPSSASTMTPKSQYQNALAGPSTAPLTLITAEPPATPTPPARLTPRERKRIITQDDPSGEGSSYKSLKRTASRAALNPTPSSPAPPPPGLMTPSKGSRSRPPTPRKAYTGPVHDPNPVNPFAVSSPKSTVSVISSPFIHAPSPRKLKEVLEMNSLRKIQERTRPSPVKGITPRTRARKRLKGETVDDTPQKQPRRQRGRRRALVGVDHGTKSAAYESDHCSSDGDLGPSPFKAATPSKQARRFTSLLEPDDRYANATAASSGDEVDRHTRPPNEMLRLFSKAVVGDDDQKQTTPATPEAGFTAEAQSPSVAGDLSETLVELGAHSIVSASESTAVEEANLGDKHATSSDSSMRSEGRRSSRQVTRRPVKILSISDGEEDEWDPEGGNVQHRVAIVPTRTRRHLRDPSSDGSQSDISIISPGAAVREESFDGSDEGDSPNRPSQTSDKSERPTRHKFGFLSLQSPTKKRKETMEALRVRALFSSAAAAQLRAVERGQEVYVSGEVGHEDELELQDGEAPAEDAGDDDWESENEGWKAVVEEESW